ILFLFYPGLTAAARAKRRSSLPIRLGPLRSPGKTAPQPTARCLSWFGGLAKTAHNLFPGVRVVSFARNSAPDWSTVSIHMQARRRPIRWSTRRGARHVRLPGRIRIHSYLTGVLDCMGFSWFSED
ncbi:hypothetical protein CORC01_02330, partial [Colletotrichum orchidophilum]